MKHLKPLGLAALTLTALLAFIGAGAASATELYKYTTPSANDTLGVGTEILLTLNAGSSLRIEETKWFPGETRQTCTTAELRVKIENVGGESSNPGGKVISG